MTGFEPQTSGVRSKPSKNESQPLPRLVLQYFSRESEKKLVQFKELTFTPSHVHRRRRRRPVTSL